MRFPACLSAFFVSSTMLLAAEPSDQDTPIRIACVGDSITYGSGIEDRERNSYPAQLAKLLGERFEVRNFGVGGATLQKRGDKPYWNLTAFKDVSAFQPDIVVIKLGTNDSKPQNWHGVEPFKIDLLAMVRQFRELPGEPEVLICTPLPVHKDAFGIREEVVRDEIVPTVKSVAEEKEVPLIDLYNALKNAGHHFPDGVHPNAEGAKLIAKAVANAVTENESMPTAESKKE